MKMKNKETWTLILGVFGTFAAVVIIAYLLGAFG